MFASVRDGPRVRVVGVKIVVLYIFDWDGTLCDSTRKIAKCMIGASEALKLPPITEKDVFNIIGLGLPEAIRVLFPEITDRDLQRVRQGYSERFIVDDQVPSELFAGVEEALAALKNSNVHIALATGKSRKGLNRVLKSLAWHDYFDSTRCADETASKPSPVMLHELLAEFARKPEQAVLIGDTEYDMAMAQSASMPRIAVSYGAHHVDRLRPYSPVMCVDSISEILSYGELTQWQKAPLGQALPQGGEVAPRPADE